MQGAGYSSQSFLVRSSQAGLGTGISHSLTDTADAV